MNMSYLVTVYNHNRERTKLLQFQFRHEAMSWLALSGFITDELTNPYTGEKAELTKGEMT
jgi:hypothetical protein